VKSCQVKVGPTGSGQRAVQVTCEAIRKKAQATQSETAGVQARNSGAAERMSRAANATRQPPKTTSSSAA